LRLNLLQLSSIAGLACVQLQRRQATIQYWRLFHHSEPDFPWSDEIRENLQRMSEVESVLK
jgi:hypothetical protein